MEGSTYKGNQKLIFWAAFFNNLMIQTYTMKIEENISNRDYTYLFQNV